MEQLHNFEILEFDKKTHQLSVCFLKSNKVINICIPIENNLYLEGESLTNYIESFMPIEEKEEVFVPSNVEEIYKLINIDFVNSYNKQTLSNQNELKRNNLLLMSDWTDSPRAQSVLDDEDKFLFAEYRQKLRDITEHKDWPNIKEWPKYPNLLTVSNNINAQPKILNYVDGGDAQIQICEVSDIFVEVYRFKRAGDVQPYNKSKSNHIGFLTRGRLKVHANGAVNEYSSTHLLSMEKDCNYVLEALDKDTIFVSIDKV